MNPTNLRKLFGIALVLALAFFISLGADDKNKNIVFLFVDDMRFDDVRYQPGLKEAAYDQGVSFGNGYADISLCCPSRASILTGQYPHNHLIKTNSPPSGGYPKFARNGGTKRAYNTWFDRRGYYTSYSGKYMNHYETTEKPPGWDDFYSWLSQPGSNEANDNGRRVSVPEALSREMDLVPDRMVEAIDEADRRGENFLVVGSIYAPHKPALAPGRHRRAFDDEAYPKRPNFNEKNWDDKPRGMQYVSPLDKPQKRRQAELWRKRQETLLAVEDAYRQVISKLRDTGHLDDTYVVFTSDQGFHLGEHRIANVKRTPYQEAARVPMTVRGPGIPEGVVRDEIVLNHDIAHTMATLAELGKSNTTDGKSFEPLLKADADEKPYRGAWRKRFLNYNWRHAFSTMDDSVAMITTNSMYNESPGGNEYYLHEEDPFELRNKYPAMSKARKNKYEKLMRELKGCERSGCRRAER